MIKRLTGAITAANLRRQRSRRARRTAPVPTALRTGLAMTTVIALAVTAFAVPAQAKVLGPGGQAAAGGVPAPSAAAGSGRGWSITPTPNPRVPTGQLFWVSCTAANSCIAVGAYMTASGRGVSLAERWNGTSWRILPIPSPARATYSALFGVACSTPSACTAVGQAIIGGATEALAERWNGARWSIQPTPNPPRGGGYLNGVACTSATACTAVGATNPFTPGSRTLAERWDGTRWSI